MFTWFDLMRQKQGNPDFETIARHFNISADQARNAMAALMPAFLLGMQHAFNPADPRMFVRSWTSLPFMNLWPLTPQAFTPQGRQAGKLVLDQLFGSDDASRRIAHQAADFTGIAVETMQQMLPLMAGIFAGGYHQWLKSHGPLQDWMISPSNKLPGQPDPAGILDLWSAWLGSSSPQVPETTLTPFEAMMQAFLKPDQTAAEPESPKPGALEFWDGFMEKGREIQKQYLASLQTILKKTWDQDS